ncbi:cysteine desulfurase NifS [Vulcanibacillus modesticaldus]|uniref:cysteine desulfurase n=1 Tax=Vulcanibacillus modesticaldus TaxID=337097 RepID=A0A1D2YT99_9BACI|nr:cysteine desulfurase family protein [Vulcanibacillus modesticaldus]OEF98919.1 cysteine desulfurase NifS [Vulcanibacillus modesticaldus]
MRQQVYLDHSATTPVHPKVFEVMSPYFVERFGNPSSIHKTGQSVRIPIEDARANVAMALHTDPSRIVFTSGGTESDYLAIVGLAFANKDKGNHIIVSEIEHSAVMQATDFLKKFGFEITYLSVDNYGKINIEELKSQLREETILISVMFVNNEIGTIQPIEEIGKIARENDIYFHTDAVQAFPIIDIDVSSLPIDLLTISSHKINGPKGIGALYVRKGVKLLPLIGGSQERSRRGGTENVPGIIGFGEACRILIENRDEKAKRLAEFKEKMIKIWKESIGENYFVINGHPTDVVPSILNVSFLGVDSHTMIMTLDMKGIAVSGGSACAAGALDISRVIKALNLPQDVTRSAIRISFGLGNTEEQIEKAAKEIAHIVKSRMGKRK